MKELSLAQASEVIGAGWFWSKRKSTDGQMNRARRPKYKKNKAKTCKAISDFGYVTGSISGVAAIINPIAGAAGAIITASAAAEYLNEGCHL